MKKKILIIDDDARNIFALDATLKAKGYQTQSCDSAAKAIDLLQSGEMFDVVLMDMMMPEIDGYEAIPLIRDIPSQANTKIIAVTAQAMPGDREKCLASGADAYLAKPVNVDLLFSLLQ